MLGQKKHMLGQKKHMHGPKNICMAEKNICIAEKNICTAEKNICIAEKNICMIQKNICMAPKNIWEILKNPLGSQYDMWSTKKTVLLSRKSICSGVKLCRNREKHRHDPKKNMLEQKAAMGAGDVLIYAVLDCRRDSAWVRGRIKFSPVDDLRRWGIVR